MLRRGTSGGFHPPVKPVPLPLPLSLPAVNLNTDVTFVFSNEPKNREGNGQERLLPETISDNTAEMDSFFQTPAPAFPLAAHLPFILPPFPVFPVTQPEAGP